MATANMTERTPTEQVIRHMLAGVFDDATPESLRAAAEDIAQVGLRRAPTIEDIDAFVSRHAVLLRSSARPARRSSALTEGLRKAKGLASAGAAAAVERMQAAGSLAGQGGEAKRRITTLRNARKRAKTLSRFRSEDAQTAAYRMQYELLAKAMDDPELAAVLDTYDADVSPGRQRQLLFSNALYVHALYAYRTGVLDWGELHGHARVLLQNRIFREYWEATRYHRASLPERSVESRIGRMIDSLARDLDESDADEWWVVGEAPEDRS
ncbi:DUF6082 family protein [Streptomyces sp. NBC_00568]|uniref:DUF6082 family protein n=1 Tax=Streptomyces sp. NBC_00568 TaxID=2975779 RepID=UPI002256CB24|nr:DUF6082 family protein [Streptomyces sp. NBC_00568]